MKEPILVVDDEPLVRMCVRELAEEVGFAVVEASNAAEALVQLTARPFCILFADIDLPGGDSGLHLAWETRERWPETNVVIMSGLLLPRASELPREVIFVTKPFSAERLLSVLGDARLGRPVG
jgi:two-component system, response regulator PdtaR